MEDTAEASGRETCWIIDIFPHRVSPEFGGVFSSVESWFLQERERAAVNRKKLHFLLKLNCFMHFRVFREEEETPLQDPKPAVLNELITRHYLTITADRLRILSDRCETCMVLYTEDAAVPKLIRELCIGEGLYLWQA
jgi:hypothetical protein